MNYPYLLGARWVLALAAATAAAFLAFWPPALRAAKPANLQLYNYPPVWE